MHILCLWRMMFAYRIICLPVRKRSGNREISVKTDDKQIENRCIGSQIVNWKPRVTDDLAQIPLLLNDKECEQRHGNHPNDHVSHCQAEQEVVGYGLQLLVHLETDHDHQVASDGDQTQQSCRNSDQSGLEWCVTTGNSFVQGVIQTNCPIWGLSHRFMCGFVRLKNAEIILYY